MRENKRILIVIILAVLLIVAALTFVIMGRSEIQAQINSPEIVEEIAAVDTVIPTVENMQEAETPQAENEETQVEPTPRAGLEATDPATVNLASGDIQLIEVFAFW